MRIVGLAAEYNPFHRGHQWQLRRLREIYGEDTAVAVVLSGCFVQRGEPAVFAPPARAEAALRCGADLVLELPLPWAMASAQGFARGAVSLLDSLGCVDALAFGSETADAEILEEVRSLLAAPELKPLLREALASGLGYAAARQQAAETLAGRPLPQLRQRNDILALSYLEALEDLGSGMEPCPMPRMTRFPPASELRTREDFPELLPEEAAEVFRRERDEGRGPVSPADLEIAVLARLRTLEPERWAALPDAAEGLERRICRASERAGSWQELVDACVTKRYPAARIRRMAMAAFLGLTGDMGAGTPGYLRVLGLNARGAEVLHAASPRLPVLTKAAKGRGDPVLELEQRARSLYALAFRTPAQRRGGAVWRQGPVILG